VLKHLSDSRSTTDHGNSCPCAAPIMIVCQFLPCIVNFSRQSSLAVKPNAKKPAGKAGKPELTEEQKQEIKEAFDLFDTDGSGNTSFHC